MYCLTFIFMILDKTFIPRQTDKSSSFVYSLSRHSCLLFTLFAFSRTQLAFYKKGGKCQPSCFAFLLSIVVNVQLNIFPSRLISSNYLFWIFLLFIIDFLTVTTTLQFCFYIYYQMALDAVTVYNSQSTNPLFL